MNRFVQCEERTQDTFLPSRLEDYVTDDNPVRVIDVFVAELDLTKLGFEGMNPQATGRCTGYEYFLHARSPRLHGLSLFE